MKQPEEKEPWEADGWEEPLVAQLRRSFALDGASSSKIPGIGLALGTHPDEEARTTDRSPTAGAHAGVRRASHGSASDEVELERMLDIRGDVCGGRGGELGRRLEAWLVEGSPEKVASKVEAE